MPAESNPDGISTASDPIVYIPVFNFGFLIDPFNVDLLKRVSSSCNLPFTEAVIKNICEITTKKSMV
jgi:hypothetical protein